MAKQVTVWTAGREIVCHPVESSVPIRKSRVGYYAFVSQLINHPHSSKDFVHVYYDSNRFDPPCYFFWGNTWFRSYVPIGTTISFVRPPSRRDINFAVQSQNAKIDQLAMNIAIDIADILKSRLS